MNRESLLEANTKKFDDIIGNGKIYKVPDFQRDYSWKLEQWEDLWEDILETIREDSTHYMGAIVLQNTEQRGKRYLVIDGQQRLATLSLIATACIRLLQENTSDLFDSEENTQNIERIRINRAKFLGAKDPVSLHYSTKLILNENNNSFYTGTLIQFGTPHTPSRLSDSEKLLWEAHQFFYDKLKEYFSPNFNGEKIAHFLNTTIADSLLFIQIVVEDDLSAYTVFETLNSRGAELTSTDLLKNYLLSLVQRGQTDLEIAKQRWKNIIDVVGLKLFPTFLRHYLNSKQKRVTRENLFKVIKPTVKNSEDVFELLTELEKHAELYIALGNEHDSFWNQNREASKYIYLFKLLGIKQIKPLLLSAYMSFNLNEFNRLLHHCFVVSFRYNTISGLNPKEMEIVYNRIAIQMREQKIKTAREAVLEMKSIYVLDDLFKANFSNKNLNSKRHKRLIKYILIELENKIANQSYDYLTESSTLEHIMPESYSDRWNEDILESVHQDFVYRLGNYTLLEDYLNRECANKSFDIKKEIYRKSKYELTKKLSEKYLEWNTNYIVNYQEYLAKLAAQIWRIDV